MLNRLDLRGVAPGDLATACRVPRWPARRRWPRSGPSSTTCGPGATRPSSRPPSASTACGSSALRVEPEALEAARDAAPEALLAALSEAREAIEAFHLDQRRGDHTFERGGIVVRGRQVPVDRAGLYVPGDGAPIPRRCS